MNVFTLFDWLLLGWGRWLLLWLATAAAVALVVGAVIRHRDRQIPTRNDDEDCDAV